MPGKTLSIAVFIQLLTVIYSVFMSDHVSMGTDITCNLCYNITAMPIPCDTPMKVTCSSDCAKFKGQVSISDSDKLQYVEFQGCYDNILGYNMTAFRPRPDEEFCGKEYRGRFPDVTLLEGFLCNCKSDMCNACTCPWWTEK